MDEEMDMYSTRDIYLAATLLSLGHELQETDFQIEGMKRRPIGYFNFPKTDRLMKDKLNYMQGKILVEPRNFIENFKALKGITESFYKDSRTHYGR